VAGFLNNRHYLPAYGIFASVDPVTRPINPATLNPYVYSRASPISLSDSSGLDPGWAHDDNPCNDAGYYNCRPGGTTNADILRGRAGIGPRQRDEIAARAARDRRRGYHPVSQPFHCPERCDISIEDDPVAVDAIEVLGGTDITYQDSGSGQAQLAFCMWPSRWSMCSTIAGEMRSEAYSAADRLAEENGWTPGQRNAFRHSYWMAMVALEYGPSTAREVGRRHEADTELLTLADLWDQRADAWNNEVGIGLVETWTAIPYADGTEVTSVMIRDQLVSMVNCDCAGSEWIPVPGSYGPNWMPMRLDATSPGG